MAQFSNDVLIQSMQLGFQGEVYIRVKVREKEHQLSSLSCSLQMTDKQVLMEFESKERKQRSYNTFLTVFVAVTFTVALLEGAGIVLFYSHFQGANIALEARIAAIEARELAVPTVELATEGSTGETPQSYVC